MSLQQHRIYALTIGNVKSGRGVRISNVPTVDSPEPIGLQITFEVSKNADNKKKKNSGQIGVYNLAPTTLALLEDGFVHVQLEVGHRFTGLKSLIVGNVREFSTVQNGSDRITTLKFGEAYTALTSDVISQYVPPGKSGTDVLKDIVSQMPGVSLGGAVAIDLSNPVTFGYSLYGTPQEMLDDFCNANRLEYRCSNNVVTVSAEGGLLSNKKSSAVLLNQDTGMIDRPFTHSGEGSRSKKDVAKAMGVQVKAILNPSITPGELIKIESTKAPELSGFYRITACKYRGDFSGNDWYVEAFCSHIKKGTLT